MGRGGDVEQVNEQIFLRDEETRKEQVAAVHIQANLCTEQASLALRRAALRIRSNVRCGDWVWWCNASCTIVLPGATLEGAQAVAKRISALLVDVECAIQILCGNTALILLQRLQAEHALLVVSKETEPILAPSASVSPAPSVDALPFLAFLASYPSYRLLHLLPYELACHYRCVPVGVERKVLTVATCQRLSYDVVTYFQEVTQRDIFQVRCEAGMIEDVLQYWQRTLLA